MLNLAFSSSYSSVFKMSHERSWNQIELKFDGPHLLYPNLPFKVLMAVLYILVLLHEGVSLLRSCILKSWPGIKGNPSPWYQILRKNMQNIMTSLWRLLYWLVFRKRGGCFITAWKFLISWLVANFLYRVVKFKCVCPLSWPHGKSWLSTDTQWHWLKPVCLNNTAGLSLQKSN